MIVTKGGTTKLTDAMQYQFVHQWFEAIVREFAQQPAIKEGDKELSYKQLNTRANHVSQVISKLNLKNNIVGVMQPTGANLIASILAAFKAGCIYLPISQEFSDKRLDQIFKENNLQLLIVTQCDFEDIRLKLEELGCLPSFFIITDADGNIETYSTEEKQAIQVAPDEEAMPLKNSLNDDSYIFYTSGSTGKAKAILGSHKSLCHFISWEIQEFGIDHTHKVSQLINPAFDASLRDIFVPLCSGSTLCVPDREALDNPVKLVEWIEDSEITLIHCVPSLLRLILEAVENENSSGHVFSALKYMLISGEPLYVRDVNNWRKKVGEHVQLVNFYGATETTMIRTFYRIGAEGDDPTRVVSIGKPISNTVVAIINNQHLCRTGEIGEVYIKTPYWTKGYLYNEALNRQVFVQNPLIKDREDIVYKTGDLGQYTKDGNIEIHGRLDHQVKVNGIRVELGEIEQVLLSLDGVSQAVVTHHINEQGGIELIAYYTGEEQDTELLKNHLLSQLNKSIIPGYIQYMDEFPLTISGKVDRKALPKPADLVSKQHTYEPVQNEVEKKLETLWQDILDMEKIGRSVSFFDIGGTSLKAIQLVSRIYKEFGVLLKVVDVFSSPTISQMGTLLDTHQEKPYEDITPVEIQERYPATYQQKQLWIHNQFEEQQVSYNMPFAFELTGSIDKRALKDALKNLVRRHESLRTTFEMDGDMLYQRVHDGVELNFEVDYIDLREHNNAEKEAERIIRIAAEHYFDLTQAPLFKTALLQLTDSRYVLFLNTHHIISDAWSMHVMAYDILRSYLAATDQSMEAQVPLEIHFKDYSAWINGQLAAEEKKLEKYWLSKFQDDIPILHLPLDFERPKQQTFSGSTHHYSLASAISQQIDEYCREQEITLFMFLISAVELVLYYYSGQKDMVIGVPVAGRHHQSLENQIGFYVNTLALRASLDPDQTFNEFVGTTRKNTLEAYAHGIYPLDKLLEQLQLSSDTRRSGLFDVMVVIQDTDIRDLALKLPEKVALKPLDLNFQSSKFDITFNFEALKEPRIISGRIEYNTSLFTETTILQIQQVLESIITLAVQSHGSMNLKDLKKSISERFEHTADVQDSSFADAQISEDF